MKIILQTVSLLAVACLLCFCKHQPTFKTDNLPTKQLRWGSGGGVVGKENSHVVLTNGQIFKREMRGELIEVKKAKAKTAADIYKIAEVAGVSTLEFNHPGNTYSFLEWQDGDMVQRVVWGDPKFPVDKGIKAIYDRLNALLKQ